MCNANIVQCYMCARGLKAFSLCAEQVLLPDIISQHTSFIPAPNKVEKLEIKSESPA